MNDVLMLTTALWNKLEQQGHLYMVILKGAMPFIEDPIVVDQEDAPEDERESVMLTFLDEQDAESYRSMVVEMHAEAVRPSELTIGKYSLVDTFGMIEELSEVSKREYGCPLRVEVAQVLGDNLLTDVLYSSFVSIN